MRFPSLVAAPVAMSLALSVAMAFCAPVALAEITVLDNAQDAQQTDAQQQGGEPALPGASPPCGTDPLTIARMSWPSAALLAEIHALLLTAEFDCTIEVVQGDLAATVSSMSSTGQPAVAPEMWVNRVADLWNGAMEAQTLRSAAPSYLESRFEGWYMPASLAAAFAGPPAAADLAQALPQLQPDAPVPFISCPIDWACSVINRNLIAAHGLEDLVEIVEPANRFEMDRLIAEALNRRDPFLFYYWEPNAVLAQLDFAAIDMGDFDAEAAQCLAERVCDDPQPSAFPDDLVVIAVAERVFTDMPAIAGYFQRATLSLADMNELLADLNAPEASPESVAERFVAEREDLWRPWVGTAP